MSKKTSKSDPFAAREAEKYERPIPSREFILTHLKRRKAPANYHQLIEELHLDEDEAQIALHRRIKAMLRDGELERLKGGLFWPSGNRLLVKGRIHIVKKPKKNEIWVIPEDASPRILLTKQNGQLLYQGNAVVVSVIDIPVKEQHKKERHKHKREGHHIREGHLVEILEQQRIVLTGRFVTEPHIKYVIPHGKELSQDILIPEGMEKSAQNGDIVVVEVQNKPSHWTEPLGTIVEVLGHEDMPGIEIVAATRAYGLKEIWSEEVLEEIKNLSHELLVSNKDLETRLDLRQLPLITIDGEDAKDFDDAVFCERTGKGWRLYVAIADVSHYVKANSALDHEARLRGNSVYFPGKVIPMLPEILSNGLCSLKPDVDRFCLVCIMHITNTGKLTRYEFHEAIMRSKARLTYTKVAAILNKSSQHLMEQYDALLPHLYELNHLYESLKKAREERGAIEFESLETRIIFGKNGKLSHIEPIQRNDAHRIIEECMLCANVATAKFLKKHKLPGLYRIHEGPPEDKLMDLRKFLQELGLTLTGGRQPEPIDYAKLLRTIQNREDANVIQTVLLRSLSQAIYSPDNIGHFGLAYSEYCHFTSPIRRYPDLMIHRQIRMVLQGKWTEELKTLSNSKEAKAALIAVGDQVSMTERRADDATRDAVRWLKCEYMQQHVGDNIYEGIISGVTRFGFFVELKDIYVDGLVHVTSLKNDYYYFDPVHHRLVGERLGYIYKLGDKVKVKVSHVDVHERKIDFELIGSQKILAKKGKGLKQKEHLRGRKKPLKNPKSQKPKKATQVIQKDLGTEKVGAEKKYRRNFKKKNKKGKPNARQKQEN